MNILLAKEWREGWRTWRIIILIVVMAVAGLISPLLAYLTPQLFRLIPDLPAGFSQMIPDPSVADAVGQYVKNVTQFGLLLLVVLTAGSIAAEKERGTAAMLFARPVRRTNAVLARWIVWALVVAGGLLIAGALALAYTTILFELMPVGKFLLLNALMLLSFLPYLSLALLASALARSQAAAYGYAFIALFVLIILGSLPRIGEFTPNYLPAWGAGIVLGQTATAWPALIVSVAIIVVALVAACVSLERQEL
ncbi:MAG: ABC transporter permease [Anaerolineae bacterium]|jgi:ABC-2 type transport system permease protein|nr:ABC transporter permease [Anaerolineae bacterium]